MDETILNAIHSHTLFSSLSKSDLESLIQYIQHVTLMPGEVLFKQGDISDSLYFLISGRLAAILSKPGEEARLVGEVKCGEVVGELGILSDRPRALTISALRESQLLKLTKKDFESFCEKHPNVWPRITSTVIARTQSLLRDISGSFPFTNIAILAANNGTPLDEFINQLKKYFNPKFTFKFVTIEDIPDPSLKNIDQVAQHMTMLENQYNYVFYIIKPDQNEWAEICIDYVDRVLLVAPGHTTPDEAEKAFYLLGQHAYQRSVRCSLVLLYESLSIAPFETAKWLDQYTFYHHHHICYTQASHMQRLTRFLTGRANGLVLGGGGARGWAEIGVLKAIIEHEIPIDMIGGTSIGSVIAACYFLSHDYHSFYALYEQLANSDKKPVRFSNLTFPIISILNGKRGTQSLQKLFGDQRIEDMWKFYFCMSTAVNSGKEMIHFRGLLWKYIRASVSLPGIFPPVVDHEHLLVDGGVSNNLPTDHMKRALENAGNIISVDISSKVSNKEMYKFPPILNFWQLLLYKLKLKHREYKFPTLMETLLESLLMGSSIRTTNNLQLSDILIKPDLHEYKMMDQTHAQEMLTIGYNTACETLKAHSDLVSKMKEG